MLKRLLDRFFPQPIVRAASTSVRRSLRVPKVLREEGRAGVKLGIGSELQRVALDPKHPHWLASEAEILELMPELRPPG